MACGQQKVKGGNGSIHCLNLYLTHCLTHCLAHCLAHHPEPRSGLCPELLADFRIPKPPGCSQGAQRAVFCAVRVADFLAEGAGWGASPGRGGELGCQALQVLKKFVRLASAFPSPPTRSLSNRKGRGRRSCTCTGTSSSGRSITLSLP